MPRVKAFIQQFHWKVILIRILVNGGALIITASFIPQVYFANRSLRAILIVAVGLGILNAFVKPVILLLTGQLIFVTFGLLVILVNTLMLYLLKWLFPNILVVNNFWWALVAGAVLGLVTNALENLLGLTPPIVQDEALGIRKRIEAGQQPTLVKLVGKPQPVIQHDVDTQSVSELTASQAALEPLQAVTPQAAVAQPGVEDFPEPPISNPPETEGDQIERAEAQGPQLDERSTSASAEDASGELSSENPLNGGAA